MVKLNVLVLGYYGKLNAGDDLLMQSICYLFKDHNLMFSSFFPGLAMLNNSDLILVGGGSIWPGNTFFELGDNLIKKLKTPYMIIGVSTKQANKTVLTNNQLLIERAKLFLVRDEVSKVVLGKSSSIVTGVDLFWTMPFEVVRALSEDRFEIGFNIRLWNNTPADYTQLVETVQNYGEVIPFPMYFGSQIHESSASMSDCELLQALKIKNIPLSFSLKAVERSNIMVAMRFHSVLMSVRAGIPTISFNYHPKIKSFFEENGLSRYCIALDDNSALNDLISDIKMNYAQISKEFEDVAEKLIKSGSVTKAIILDSLSNVKKRELTFINKLKRKIINIIEF
ncbi:polysaccharide pyruvyl transferase family protein [Rheinheimera salexigens]|uniref:Uncharacterized protein n=1 Tax=Rheinheimera salexigens TaxID=1628148 RepID=A0A1E7Q790_9GAMM|nr:polysaccharide pyruvyl transferase family protein [Rheinheimera salexigens]OEY69980.1 hypothetical protein BI198_10685 [Rheinheimera salexigens]